MNVFELVKKEADSRKLTIQEVEKLAGVSNGSISKWGKSVPKADGLLRVAAVFDLPMEYFLTDGSPVLNYLSDKSERELLSNFRLLNSQDQHQIQLLIYAELSRTENTDELPPIPFAASGWADVTPENENVIQQKLQAFEKRSMEMKERDIQYRIQLAKEQAQTENGEKEL